MLLLLLLLILCFVFVVIVFLVKCVVVVIVVAADIVFVDALVNIVFVLMNSCFGVLCFGCYRYCCCRFVVYVGRCVMLLWVLLFGCRCSGTCCCYCGCVVVYVVVRLVFDFRVFMLI